jgi:hypothetical protein
VIFARGAVLVAFVLLTACTTTGTPMTMSATPPATTADRTTGWFVDSAHAPPVAGHKTGLYFEYVPAPSASDPGPLLNGRVVDRALPFRAECVSCGVTIDAVAERYDLQRPEDASHAGATAAFGAAMTFPMPGLWQLDPFGCTIDVRAVSVFEPPLVHVRPWSGPLLRECGREQIARLLRGFQMAYNSGDAALLADVGQGAIDFSIGGGSVPVAAIGREAFVRTVIDRQARGERIEFTVAHLATIAERFAGGQLDAAIDAVRTGPDLPGGRQSLTGKASIACAQQPQFIRLNLAIRP